MPAKPKVEKTDLERLSEKFPAKEVKDNPRGFPYVSIDTVMNRLDDVLKEHWDLDVLSSEVTLVPRAEYTYGSREKTAFLGRVTVVIRAFVDGREVARSGVGADVADDPDKVIKTALANAVKKAANGFGVGRYLWDAEERASLAAEKEATTSIPQLKKKVVEIFESKFGELTGTAAEKAIKLGEAFSVDPGDLGSPETLTKIIEGN